ncbi:DUF2029 domain-containing protein [Stakelama tenebrarum]|uniref:DUF2029 domain-containing protein n=1 Tax=Stakelama tenebrarum TaxID=2711215 RepID=A0A6G6Y0K0_9SPHN|nr:DUF2029 domain-containing protein [Sphingosinithalassobacter tenebrarum]QIG78337.1 DUF2029 domain-containing protein [Sphingosinithalassobacter tenebrarum]
MSLTGRRAPAIAALALALAILALARPIDHDESQYVASAVLGWGNLPYRDFAYLQTPLQALLFAPIAALLGHLAWPGLRLVNAGLGLITLLCVWRAAREAEATKRNAVIATALFATTDILLFSIGVARNDALPGALMAAALIPILRAARGQPTPAGAFLAGLLLASAAAAKISLAFPAAAYGFYTLWHRRHLPLWVAAGALGPTLLVAALWIAAPAEFLFGVLVFPSAAPSEYYAAGDRAWKLWTLLKPVDTVKFLALGPGLAALLFVARHRPRTDATLLCTLLSVSALIAALLPTPIWRQYLLPMLPPLFVGLAIVMPERLSAGWKAGFTVFAAAGMVPSLSAVLSGKPAMVAAWQESTAIGEALSRADIKGPVATLSPQFLPGAGGAIDPRFATGPFYFRATSLLTAAQEPNHKLVSARTMARHFAQAPPAAILVGGEGEWTSGNPRLDARLEGWAVEQRWRRVPLASNRFRLYVPD